MTAIVLEPHADDCVLFSCWNALRYRAHVVTVFESHVQEARGYGIPQAQREAETEAAMSMLGLDWHQWPYLDSDPDWTAIGVALTLIKERLTPDRVFAPAVEPGGHDQHNRVGALAVEVFGADRVTAYLTYTVNGKSTRGVEVMYEPAWVTLKLRALACYRSQIEASAAGCTPHFVRGLDEYVAS